MSTALTLLTHVWKHGAKDSWGRVNTSMYRALSLAIGSGLQFDAEDFETIYDYPRNGGFNGGYWVGSESEWIYSMAVENGNASAYQAWEEYKGRKPFFANDVRGTQYGTQYLHTSQMRSQRCRLAVGFSFPIEGKRWFVTSFDDEAGIMRAALYNGYTNSGKPKKLRKFTHEEISELFPAPKKAKVKQAA